MRASVEALQATTFFPRCQNMIFAFFFSSVASTSVMIYVYADSCKLHRIHKQTHIQQNNTHLTNDLTILLHIKI